MPYYYLDAIPDDGGIREVHEASCIFVPADENHRIPLGNFNSCWDAIEVVGERHYSPSIVDGCVFCSPECRMR